MSFRPPFRRFVRAFGFSGVRASRIAEGLHNSDSLLTAAERARLEELAESVADGARLSAAEANEAAGLLARVVPRYTVRMLICADTGQFAVPQLREIYLRETAGLSSAPSVQSWINRLDDASEAAGVLRWLCGDDFRAQAVSRVGLPSPLVQFNSIPAPTTGFASRTRAQVLASVMSVVGADRHLFDRLRVLFDTGGAHRIPHMLAVGTTPRWVINILRGNVAELLTREQVLSVIREGGAFGHTLPSGAVLVTGARVRRAGSAASVLFTDGLVGAIVDGRWHWYGVVEVKSNVAGLGDAAEQVMSWRDVSGLNTSFTLEFPEGSASLIALDGTLTPSPGHSFDFNPAAAADAREIHVPRDTVEQFLVAPRPGDGSRFDLTETRASVPGVRDITHSYRSSDLDYVTGLVLQETSNHTSMSSALEALTASAGIREVIAAE
jgi:hypothetical protein